MPLDEQTRLWIRQGKQNGRAYLLVVEDTRDGLRFPSFVRSGDSLQASIDRLNGKSNTAVVRTIAI